MVLVLAFLLPVLNLMLRVALGVLGARFEPQDLPDSGQV